MKFFAVLILALTVQSYAYRLHDSSEEMEGRNYRNYNVQKQLEDILQSASVERTARWESSASALPEATSYKTKVAQRINGSMSLAEKPELKTKLYKLADEKLENCKKPNGQELDRHCVGRTTGQVMQLIAAVENVNRETLNGATSYRRNGLNY